PDACRSFVYRRERYAARAAALARPPTDRPGARPPDERRLDDRRRPGPPGVLGPTAPGPPRALGARGPRGRAARARSHRRRLDQRRRQAAAPRVAHAAGCRPGGLDRGGGRPEGQDAAGRVRRPKRGGGQPGQPAARPASPGAPRRDRAGPPGLSPARLARYAGRARAVAWIVCHAASTWRRRVAVWPIARRIA